MEPVPEGNRLRSGEGEKGKALIVSDACWRSRSLQNESHPCGRNRRGGAETQMKKSAAFADEQSTIQTCMHVLFTYLFTYS